MSKISPNSQLEEALMFAGQANDIASLKALARSESRKAAELESLLVNVLAMTGRVILPNPMSATHNGFSITPLEGGKIVIEAEQVSL